MEKLGLHSAEKVFRWKRGLGKRMSQPWEQVKCTHQLLGRTFGNELVFYLWGRGLF